MINRKFIYDLHREKESSLSRYSRLSANILSRVSRELDKHPIPYQIDCLWAYHLIIFINGKSLSVYSGGWDNKIEIARLKINGQPYEHNEKVFLTPKGTVNYILKKYGNWQNE